MQNMKFLFRCLLIFWFSTLCLGAERNVIFKTSYFVDVQGTASIETVQNQTFKAYENELRLGYSDHPIWIRVQVAPLFEHLSFQANPLKLRIGPYFTDWIEKYESVNHTWEKSVKGAVVKETNEACSEDAHCFKLLSNPAMANTIYLKVQTHGVIYLHMDVLHAEDMAFLNIEKVRKSTVSLALSVIFLLSTIAFFLYRPSYMVFSYICLQIAIVFNLFYATGLITYYVDFLSPEQIKTLSYYVACMRAILIAQLVFSLLRSYELSKGYYYLLYLIGFLTIIDLLLIPFGYINLALKVQLGIHLFNVLTQIYGLFTGKIKHQNIKNLLLVATIVYLVLFLLGVSNIFSLTNISAPFVVQYYSNLNGTFVGTLLLIVGIYEARRTKLDIAVELEKLKLISNESKLNQERLHERSTLIDLLTHELMNPLGTIKFSLASLQRPTSEEETTFKRLSRIESSVDRMKNLIEQVALSNRLEIHEITYPLERFAALNFIEALIGDYADESRFSLDVDPSLCFYSNPILLNHVIKNLIDNAYKYDSREGPITISVRKCPVDVLSIEQKDPSADKQQLVFEISNFFAENQKPDELKIFDRYYRQENVMTKPGMGIGLSIVKTALDKLNGEIQFSISERRAVFKLIV